MTILLDCRVSTWIRNAVFLLFFLFFCKCFFLRSFLFCIISIEYGNDNQTKNGFLFASSTSSLQSSDKTNDVVIIFNLKTVKKFLFGTYHQFFVVKLQPITVCTVHDNNNRCSSSTTVFNLNRILYCHIYLIQSSNMKTNIIQIPIQIHAFEI